MGQAAKRARLPPASSRARVDQKFVSTGGSKFREHRWNKISLSFTEGVPQAYEPLAVEQLQRLYAGVGCEFAFRVDKPQLDADEAGKQEEGKTSLFLEPLPNHCQLFRRGKDMLDERDVLRFHPGRMPEANEKV